MEINFPKPKVVISKCLTFAPCRYDGKQINDKLIEEFKDYIEFIPTCPEVEIGLSTPRQPIRLVQGEKEKKLVQPKTGRDLTAKMKRFSREFLTSLPEVDGFILKNRSPTCASKDSKIYPAYDSKVPADNTSGLFAEEIKNYYPNKVVTNEGRLKSFRLREDFLAKLFSLARFRKVKEAGSLGELVNFQAKHKFLFLAYNEEKMRSLGKIAANSNQEDDKVVIKRYETVLQDILGSKREYTADINVLMHAFGFFSDQLTKDEKDYFLNALEKYRQNQIPLSVPNGILKSWIIKYNQEYLKKQVFFAPYPEELVKISDSGKGRDL